MANIGGNVTAKLQIRTGSGKNSIGERVPQWNDAAVTKGWLGMQSGDSKYTNFNAKAEESTHVFLCDYRKDIYALRNSDTRLIFDGIVYDVLLIDNPDEMNEQLEIYLKRVGAWNGE